MQHVMHFCLQELPGTNLGAERVQVILGVTIILMLGIPEEVVFVVLRQTVPHQVWARVRTVDGRKLGGRHTCQLLLLHSAGNVTPSPVLLRGGAHGAV